MSKYDELKPLIKEVVRLVNENIEFPLSKKMNKIILDGIMTHSNFDMKMEAYNLHNVLTKDDVLTFTKIIDGVGIFSQKKGQFIFEFNSVTEVRLNAELKDCLKSFGFRYKPSTKSHVIDVDDAEGLTFDDYVSLFESKITTRNNIIPRSIPPPPRPRF